MSEKRAKQGRRRRPPPRWFLPAVLVGSAAVGAGMALLFASG